MPSEFHRRLPCNWDSRPGEKPEWWWNMLDCRFDVAGTPQPLFLAIRNDSLNAYAEGQSIFKISFGKDGEPSAKIHHKYVCKGAEGVKYLTLRGDKINGKTYEGSAMLDKWVANARCYREGEKKGIAQILAKNGCVIDVEMGLPASRVGDHTDEHGAPRMDIVALEKDGDTLKIVFYEMKLFSNSSLRARSHIPEVLAQLKRYETWINNDDRKEQIVSAYRNACKILIKLNGIRYRKAGKDVHRFIEQAAAKTAMEIDPKPRLIIFEFDYDPKRQCGAWTGQEEDLRQGGICGIRLIMQPRPEDITLPETTEEAYAAASRDHASQIGLELKHRRIESSDLSDPGDQEGANFTRS